MPEDVDEYFTVTFLIFFLIGYAIMTNANGIATLVFLEEEYNIPNDLGILGENDRILKKYAQDITISNNRARVIIFWLYFGALPLWNLYYMLSIYIRGSLRVRRRVVNRRLKNDV